MIGQIGYLGQVSFRVGTISALLYTLGVTQGAAILGATIGACGLGVRWLLNVHVQGASPGMWILVASVALLGGLRDLGFHSLRIPECRLQLPRHYLQVFGPYKTSLYWGWSVGLGRRTRVTYHLYYVLVLLIFVTGKPAWGALALGCYGLANGCLLILEVAAIGMGASLHDGLLGSTRGDRFYAVSGGALVGYGALLLLHSTLHLIHR